MRKLLIVFAAFAFVVAYTLPAMAADWNFYGSARIQTFMDDVDPGGGGESDTDLDWYLQSNSRIGAKVKAGEVGGRFEYSGSVDLRLLYGTMPFGGGTLLVGQDYSPTHFFMSNQTWGGDTGLLNTGGCYDGRRPMLKYSTGGLKIALVQPSTGDIVEDAPNTNTTIPKISTSYSFKAGPAALKLVFGYNSYEEEGAAGSYDIDSYVVGVGWNIGLGAAYVKGNVYTGTNTGPYGLWQRGLDDPYYSAADDEIEDTDTTGYMIVVGFKTSDTLKFEAGYGRNEHDNDVFTATDDCGAMYVQAVITMGKGCYLVPEVGAVSLEDNAAAEDEGEITYWGAKWQINF